MVVPNLSNQISVNITAVFYIDTERNITDTEHQLFITRLYTYIATDDTRAEQKYGPVR